MKEAEILIILSKSHLQDQELWKVAFTRCVVEIKITNELSFIALFSSEDRRTDISRVYCVAKKTLKAKIIFGMLTATSETRAIVRTRNRRVTEETNLIEKKITNWKTRTELPATQSTFQEYFRHLQVCKQHRKPLI